MDRTQSCRQETPNMLVTTNAYQHCTTFIDVATRPHIHTPIPLNDKHCKQYKIMGEKNYPIGVYPHLYLRQHVMLSKVESQSHALVTPGPYPPAYPPPEAPYPPLLFPAL